MGFGGRFKSQPGAPRGEETCRHWGSIKASRMENVSVTRLLSPQMPRGPQPPLPQIQPDGGLAGTRPCVPQRVQLGLLPGLLELRRTHVQGHDSLRSVQTGPLHRPPAVSPPSLQRAPGGGGWSAGRWAGRPSTSCLPQALPSLAWARSSSYSGSSRQEAGEGRVCGQPWPPGSWQDKADSRS